MGFNGRYHSFLGFVLPYDHFPVSLNRGNNLSLIARAPIPLLNFANEALHSHEQHWELACEEGMMLRSHACEVLAQLVARRHEKRLEQLTLAFALDPALWGDAPAEGKKSGEARFERPLRVQKQLSAAAWEDESILPLTNWR